MKFPERINDLSVTICILVQAVIHFINQQKRSSMGNIQSTDHTKNMLFDF